MQARAESMSMSRSIGGPVAGIVLLLVVAGVVLQSTGSSRDGEPAGSRQGGPGNLPVLASAKHGGKVSDSPLFSDADLGALRVSARSDPNAAQQLGNILSLCSLLLGESHSDRKPSRFDDVRWAPWTRMCEAQSPHLLMSEMDLWAQPQGSLWEELDLVDALGNTPEENEIRNEVAFRILEKGDDPELMAQAALLYFDRERLREWAPPGMTGALARGGLSEFRVDLALLLACRVGRDCTARSIQSVAECAMTAMCYPGMTLEQVIALRQSPQEMKLLQLYVDRVLAVRN